MSTENEYEAALLDLLNKTKPVYNPKGALSMVRRKGGCEAARLSIMMVNLSQVPPKLPKGLVELWMRKKLCLSIEAHLYRNKQFHCLFDKDIIQRCKETLTKLEYL